MSTITNIQSGDVTTQRIQSQILSQLNTLSKLQLASSVTLPSVTLSPGNNFIDHGLGRVLQGWFITRMRTNFSQVYDLQDLNRSQDKTLLLVSSATVVVDLIVY